MDDLSTEEILELHERDMINWGPPDPKPANFPPPDSSRTYFWECAQEDKPFDYVWPKFSHYSQPSCRHLITGWTHEEILDLVKIRQEANSNQFWNCSRTNQPFEFNWTSSHQDQTEEKNCPDCQQLSSIIDALSGG